MKAWVVLVSVSIVISSHVLQKRSILEDGDHHHNHQLKQERIGRDTPVSAPAGYLPPTGDDYEDYSDDSARFGAGNDNSDANEIRGFGQEADDYDDGQTQYGQTQNKRQEG